ncbi:protocadherin gamma-C3-like isoform X3 [Pantherophis guttatus]|uniref:Protocadherin gamma-C3-like isoform X3 n=1 Tax=Pantherophis guttatus TaxID=94885 RepID=A0A6P9ASQ6_PANGU|nr:protocadherin gamma-C3-like isoform X3 [Pantherophis guttatus]XP_060542800.1 protocadherin gamma-C3-like isoform X3 [Pantherophis guttatus]
MNCAAGKNRWVTQWLQLLGVWLGVSDWAFAFIRYTIPEEMPKSSLVGNVVLDLGLDLQQLQARNLRVVSGGSRKYFEADLNSGKLLVNERIDREELCASLSPCVLSLQIIAENPLELYGVAVEVQDINDNDPVFLSKQMRLEISESVSPGARFPLESAQDPDVGINSLQTYQLSSNQHYALNVQTGGDNTKYAELVLEKTLDREQQKEILLILTALDGGNPPRSATLQVLIDVLDANDNVPIFNQSIYKASVREDTPLNTLVARIRAFDLDEGPNGEIVYSFSSHTPARVRQLFVLDSDTGELRLNGLLDFEEIKFYEIYVQAKDKGTNPAEAHCKILVEIIDVNDNIPEITVTSVYSPVPEDAAPGTVIALLSVTDQDSGDNGLVNCFIPFGTPFALSSSLKNYYTLQMKEPLDREIISEYNITITAQDAGSPSLMEKKQIFVKVSDINDNPPTFPQSFYDVYVEENNLPGAIIFNISASDPDLDRNSRLSYSILENEKHDRDLVSRFFSINRENGTIYILALLDYENIMEFTLVVQVRDGGFLALATNITINIFVTDQNDNVPRVLYPTSGNSSLFSEVMSTVNPGYLVTKIVAWDADAGYNAWLSYVLHEATDPGLFALGLYSGEITTTRSLQEEDSRKQTLIILIKDHGEPALSSTATLIVTIAETSRETLTDFTVVSTTPQSKKHLTFYLILAIILISVAFFVTVVGVGSYKFYKWRQSKDIFKASRSNLYRTPEPFNHVDTVRSGFFPPDFYQQVLTTDSCQSDLLYKMPFAPSTIGSHQSTITRCVPAMYNQIISTSNRLLVPSEQAQPNTDWRFSQAQRPGTSGSQNGDENGTWPNNQFDTEMLQAMILASANEAAAAAAANPDGNSTLGGGATAGTMGLSTRYGPQFTLQHVPDYRQNVYIPGSTATLSNSAGKRDGKPAASGGGNKKKSGKKEKK